MSVIASHRSLDARELQNTIGQSGMTPTAFSFLVPIFVVAIIAPFLCVFCIRRRRQALTVTPLLAKTKKPALRRAEARERLNEVTEASNVRTETEVEHIDTVEANATVDSSSVLERECAICLSTLHAPAPPEPAKLSDAPITDEAAKLPTIEGSTEAESETILKLQVCQHEFHAECLVSWFVLRKTSCPICRAVYYSKEAMQAHDDEEEAQLAAAYSPQTPATLEAQAPIPERSRWRSFIHKFKVGRREERTINAVELQPTQSSPQPPQ